MNVYEGVVMRNGGDFATFVCVAKSSRRAIAIIAKHLEHFGVIDPTIEYHIRHSDNLDYVGESVRARVLIFRMDRKPTRIIPQPSVN